MAFVRKPNIRWNIGWKYPHFQHVCEVSIQNGPNQLKEILRMTVANIVNNYMLWLLKIRKNSFVYRVSEQTSTSCKREKNIYKQPDRQINRDRPRYQRTGKLMNVIERHVDVNKKYVWTVKEMSDSQIEEEIDS